MTREQLRQLHRGQRLRDGQDRTWTVQAAPFEEDGLTHAVIRSGDLVRRLDERWADDYEVVAKDTPGMA